MLSNSDLVGEDQLRILMDLDIGRHENIGAASICDVNLHDFEEVSRPSVVINGNMTLDEADMSSRP